MNRGKIAPPPRPRWLLRFVIVAAVVAGGYLLLKPRDVAPAPGGAVASRSPQGARGSGRGPLPLPQPGNGMFPPGAKVTEQKVVELNSATLAEIETIPGVTPEYARKIIAGRPYQSMSDLARTGIPRAILDDISPPAVIRTTGRASTPSTPRGSPR